MLGIHNWGVHRPQVGPTIILLNGHSIKSPSKFMPLYPYISVALRSHLRSCFVLWMEADAEPTAENTGQWSVQPQMRHICITQPLAGLREHYERRGRKIAGARSQEGLERNSIS